jgi:hypothetical protein
LNDRKFLTFLWPEAALHPAGKVKKLVVDAVWCERVSRPVSLLYAKKTGKIAEKRGHLPGSTRKSGGFSPLFARACQIGTGNLAAPEQERC